MANVQEMVQDSLGMGAVQRVHAPAERTYSAFIANEHGKAIAKELADSFEYASHIHR